MEFRPYWELLEELGIDLPNTNPKETRKPAETKRPGAAPREQVLQYLGGLIEDCTIAGQKAWIPADKTVQVDRYTIPGLVYVGDGLMSLRSFNQTEPCLIRPKLKVQCPYPDYQGTQMPYSPSYTQMKPASRAAYLEWLSTGRRKPNVAISYVWLFFYGLERRVFHDFLGLKTNEYQTELNQIIAEVEQLEKLYGDRSYGISGTFGYKANSFLDLCRAMRSRPLYETVNPLEASPLAVQIALGQLLQQGQSIPADWAIAWWSRLGKKQLKLAATRCFSEFQALFRVRYAQHYGEGLKFDPKVNLKLEYQPMNHSFGRSVPINLVGLPDVTQFPGKLSRVGDVVESCTIELEPLSRFLGRNPNDRNSSAAIALLPSILLSTHGGTVVKKLQKWLEKQFLESQTIVISGKELFKYWSGVNAEKLTKSEAIGLSHLLEQLGYGVEPDPRFGGALPTIKSNLVLFQSSVNADLSPEYFEATLAAHLATLAVTAKQSAIHQESDIEHNLEPTLLTFTTLKVSEQQRLNAHLQWLRQEKLTLKNLKTRIDSITLEQRSRIAKFLVQLVNGQPTPELVQLLEKVYDLLGLEAQSLYREIHVAKQFPLWGNRTTQEPVTVRNAAPIQGYQIPLAPSEFALNMTLVQSKLAESQEVSNLLAEIFVEETAIAPKTIAGLDADHTAFLLALSKQTCWQRDELNVIALQFNLMLDGALETINELAFDRCDEPIFEGDDHIEVNADVLQELLA
ncbi:tellurite resistance TerB family protein [Phormidesmis sp. 146-33]